jgi:type VI secretion system VgrG family protein
MTYLTSKKFDFRSSALPAGTFGVVSFRGFEGFSKPYEFDIMLVSSDPEIDLTAVLQNPAVFTILREEEDILFNGIVAEFEQMHAVDEHVFYKALLVPRFWWLSLIHHNQIFLDKTVPEIIGAVLEDGGLVAHDYEFKTSKTYPRWEYICQYGESHLNFVCRWMEREGMYYYFEQTENGEKLIITDTHLAHNPMDQGKTMYYSPASGLDELHREEVIKAIVCKQKLLPARLHVNDYNYRTPSLSLTAEAEVSARGRGEVHLYGEHFRTPQEGRDLARVRAEELLCHEKRFHGQGTIPFLRPGYLFELEDHYRDSFNRTYLTIELVHEGSQSGFLLAGIQKGLAEVEKQSYYRNSFVAIPAEVQYRHPKTTEKPRFNGTINARIDAEGSGEYAELDDQGRYKVRLPFDISEAHLAGKASHWLRMAQSYAGENQGMHFPLHKGTEVLLTFIEGDPDRPIIAGAVPNPETPSPVGSTNSSKSMIKTGRGPKTGSVGAEYVKTQAGTRPTGNYIEFNDRLDNELIRIEVDADRDTTVTAEPPASQMLVVEPPDFANTYAGLKTEYEIVNDPPGLYVDYGDNPNWRPDLTGSALTAEQIKDWLKRNEPSDNLFNIPTKDQSARFHPFWDSNISKRQQYEMDHPAQEPWQYSPVVRREEIAHGSYREHVQGDMITKVEGTWDCTIKGHLYNTTWGHVHSDYYQTHSESYYDDVLDVYGQPSSDNSGDVTVTEIAYGPKYEWHFGDKMEWVDGNVYESHTGEKYEYIEGTLHEEQVGGRKTIIKKGDAEIVEEIFLEGAPKDSRDHELPETVGVEDVIYTRYGNYRKTVRAVEEFWGTKEERIMGAQSSMIAGNQNAFVFGLKIDTWAGGAINSFLGFALNLFAAMQFNIFAAGNIDISSTYSMASKTLDFTRINGLKTESESLTLAQGNYYIGNRQVSMGLNNFTFM